MVVPPLALGTVWVGKKIRPCTASPRCACRSQRCCRGEPCQHADRSDVWNRRLRESALRQSHRTRFRARKRACESQRKLYGWCLVRRICRGGMGSLEWRESRHSRDTLHWGPHIFCPLYLGRCFLTWSARGPLHRLYEGHWRNPENLRSPRPRSQAG